MSISEGHPESCRCQDCKARAIRSLLDKWAAEDKAEEEAPGFLEVARIHLETANERDALRSQVQEITRKKYGDAGLKLLFEIQEACPEARVASGLLLGVEILLKDYHERGKKPQSLMNENTMLLKALDQAHRVNTCPYNAYDQCLPCLLLKKAMKEKRI